ncbi:MAG: hypothetical protein IJ822_02010, partial [Pyramidobacter sp.]|nr:hypothetical protein [Pyramidobacter sp.]
MTEDLSEIKKVLRSAYWIQKRLDGALDRLLEMRARIENAGGISYDRIWVSGGSERNPLEDAVNALIDYEREVELQTEKWTAALRLVNDIILGVSDERLRVLLTYRYHNFWHWEKIACEMNYSWKQVHRLHVQ